MDAQGGVGVIGGGHGGASSPTSVRNGTANAKRKRSGAGFESSPGSVDIAENEEDEAERRRQPGVKRACNECRQQKLRCDVVQDPFTTCSRCMRLKLECKIESNFKRVGKRSKHAEMEKQIESLRRSLQRAQAQGYAVEEEEDIESPMGNGLYSNSMNNSSFLRNSDEAVSSLLHLKQSGNYNIPRVAHQLEDVRLTEDQVNQLFNDYFTYYHPFLPFLNPSQPPEQYFTQCPLLFWAIISVSARRTNVTENLLTSLAGPLSRLLWTTIGGVPGSHYAIKALCLLCTWSLPTSTTATDPTHILSGVLMKAATGIGLHRPSHAQDFSRVSVEFNKDELHDRVTTWAVCNIVSQTIGTGYGQPATTLYDWTLAIRPGDAGPFQLSAELEARLRIERFTDKVSKEMFSNASDPQGVSGDELRAMLTRIFRREYADLEASILSDQNLSPFITVFLKAAGLHLRLAAFFDSRSTPNYMDDLLGLWRATTGFLTTVFSLETPTSTHTGNILQYGTNYISQMIVAAGFALLKLLSSFFSAEIDFDRGRQLFHKTIQAIRSMSVTNNDLLWRLAELMAQMWNGLRADKRTEHGSSELDGSMQLKVRCRHSMSLVYDTIWRWREEYQAQGRGSIEGTSLRIPRQSAGTTSSSWLDANRDWDAAALKNPTNPESAEDSRASSTPLDSTLAPPPQTLHQGLPNHLAPSLSGLGGMSGYGESNYEVFDPLNWMLDGLVDFPYSYAAVQGLETQGMS
ncbi:hypothetical protein VF21_04042 [Pseudogymnoascus sp. 05NY08]|nr:hypothetical protein VF21_04042 [Pseudogymnoascus sp. 05NY08]